MWSFSVEGGQSLVAFCKYVIYYQTTTGDWINLRGKAKALIQFSYSFEVSSTFLPSICNSIYVFHIVIVSKVVLLVWRLLAPGCNVIRGNLMGLIEPYVSTLQLTQAKSICLGCRNKAQWVCRPQPLKNTTPCVVIHRNAALMTVSVNRGCTLQHATEEVTTILAERNISMVRHPGSSTQASQNDQVKPMLRDLPPMADGRRQSRGFGRSPRTPYNDLNGAIHLRSQPSKAEHRTLLLALWPAYFQPPELLRLCNKLSGNNISATLSL